MAREKVSQEEKRGQRTGGLGSQHQDSGFSSDVEKSWGLRKSSLPGSSVQGIFQARVLEGVAISFSRESS